MGRSTNSDRLRSPDGKLMMDRAHSIQGGDSMESSVTVEITKEKDVFSLYFKLKRLTNKVIYI